LLRPNNWFFTRFLLRATERKFFVVLVVLMPRNVNFPTFQYFEIHVQLEWFAKTRETNCNNKGVIKCNALKTKSNQKT